MKLTPEQVAALLQHEPTQRRVLLNDIIVYTRKHGDPVQMKDIAQAYHDAKLVHKGFHR